MGVATKNKKKLSDGSATEVIYEELKRRILSFEIPPGAALEERQILQSLALSRTPLRGACMRLKEEGWLLAFSRRGFLVAPIGFEDIAQTYELRLILETACAQLAAVRATNEDIERLEAMIQQEESGVSTDGVSAELIKMNYGFHLFLAELSKNSRLVKIIRNILEHVTRFDSMLSRYAPSTTWVRHRAIIEAVKAHDPISAGKSMQEHIEHARVRIVSAFSSGFADFNPTLADYHLAATKPPRPAPLLRPPG